MKRYAIMVRANYPGATLNELCRCDTNPEEIVKAVQQKTLTLDLGGGRKVRQPKYAHVGYIDLAHTDTQNA